MIFLYQILIVCLLAGLFWWAFTTILANVPLPTWARAIITVFAVLAICEFAFTQLGWPHLLS